MEGKILFFVFIYMTCIYLTGSVFAMGNDFLTDDLIKVNEGPLYDKIEGSEVFVEESGDYVNMTHFDRNWWDDMPIIGGLGKFFGSITAFFGMIFDFLTFNIVAPAAAAPPYPISIILLCAVIPVWIYLIALLAPYAIDTIKAIGNLIPFT